MDLLRDAAGYAIMNDLPPGRELDALIAEKVMKITTGKVYGPRGGHIGWHDESGCHSYNLKKIWPPYSTKIVHAWRVVEKVKELKRLDFEFRLEFIYGKWHCDMGSKFTYVHDSQCCVPAAICLAALKAVQS